MEFEMKIGMLPTQQNMGGIADSERLQARHLWPHPAAGAAYIGLPPDRLTVWALRCLWHAAQNLRARDGSVAPHGAPSWRSVLAAVVVAECGWPLAYEIEVIKVCSEGHAGRANQQDRCFHFDH